MDSTSPEYPYHSHGRSTSSPSGEPALTLTAAPSVAESVSVPSFRSTQHAVSLCSVEVRTVVSPG